MPTLRNETWVKDFDGMLSTFDVTVRDHEKVWTVPSIVAELGLDPGLGREVVDSTRERFVIEFHYQAVADALTHEGWSLAEPS